MRKLQGTRKVSGLSALFFLTVLLSTSSCEKNNEIGISLQPETDRLEGEYTDTVTVWAHTVKADSITTRYAISHVLGMIQDPVLGHTAADMYLRLSLPLNNLDLIHSSEGGTVADIAIDSVVLKLTYTGEYYGKASTLNMEALELAEAISSDSAYFTTSAIPDLGTNLILAGHETVNFSPEDSVTIDGTKLSPHLRVKLDPALGEAFAAQSGTANFADNDAFAEYFKGFHLQIQDVLASGEGGLYNFKYGSTLSGVSIYYRDNFGDEPDTTSVHFPFAVSTPKFTSIERDYTGTGVEAQLADSTLGQTEVYVQGMGGLNIKLHIPYLEKLQDSFKIGINRAELVLPLVDGSDQDFAPLELVHGKFENEDGDLLYLPDDNEFDQLISHTRFDEDQNAYLLDLTRYVQRRLNGTTAPSPLYILPKFDLDNPKRSIIKGTNVVGGMNLRVYYTKY